MALRERMRNGLMYILLVYSAIYGLLWFVMLLWHGTVPMRKNILLIFTLFFEPSQFIKIASAVLPFALIAALALLIGTVSPSETIKRFGRWRARRWKAKLDKQLKEKGERLLFGARIKKESFFGGYPIGLVTKLYQKQGKPYCNIFFPNIGGLITVSVPLEDLEIAEESLEELLAFYLSLGFV